ncbi:DNA alkylation repair protein [Thalassotalea euphylliae]|uniref:DNA alkylation repair protein n=1 Tax=Thalassotalea euphylliae TaxID=1655234 RepID=A0A3E0TMM0_9GAMM|nr:DNA alkylation repair protein [Thalassotalea euphylliae]REL25776.1 DNA alkylation repair protein [Thalassotalea euphylliae]
MTTDQVLASLQELSNPAIAEHSARFFKTGKGQYGEGDKFLGIRVPQVRAVVKQYKSLPLPEISTLLHNEYHEVRLCALLMLVTRFKRKHSSEQQAIFDCYMENLDQVNNWDLVDSSAHPILGGHLFDKDRQLLYHLVQSRNLWHRRIAIITTYYFIKCGDFTDTLALSKTLLADHHDLIHKAVGWMLREVGKKDHDVEYQFLKQHYKAMPRTMLRYAIEKFPAETRAQFLAGTL